VSTAESNPSLASPPPFASEQPSIPDPAGARKDATWAIGPLEKLENDRRLDMLADRVARIAERVGSGSQGETLRGEWFGHALHPMLTDFPLGCWMSACWLDLLGGRSSRKGAQRLVALGVLTAMPTAASGLADFATINDPKSRRVGAVHALGNTIVLGCYIKSWSRRRSGRYLMGKFWALAGGSLAWVTGYLGGHLSLGRGVGQGLRGTRPRSTVTQAPTL